MTMERHPRSASRWRTAIDAMPARIACTCAVVVAAACAAAALPGCATLVDGAGTTRVGIGLWGFGDPPGVNWNLDWPRRELPELPRAPPPQWPRDWPASLEPRPETNPGSAGQQLDHDGNVTVVGVPAGQPASTAHH